ncbi:MAG: F0F1 ATP synthase subunit A [Phycisphaerales bacterium]
MDLLTLAAADNPVNHVTNHWTWKIGDYWIWSANQTNLVLAALIIILAGLWITRRPKSDAAQGNERYLPRDPFSHMIEVICVYLRDQAVEPLLHKRTNRFLPFLLVLFFFILVNNLLGLLPIIDLVSLFNHEMVERGQAPIGGTATQNIAVTGVLALIAAVVINIAGVKELGVGGIKHFHRGGLRPGRSSSPSSSSAPSSSPPRRHRSSLRQHDRQAHPHRGALHVRQARVRGEPRARVRHRQPSRRSPPSRHPTSSSSLSPSSGVRVRNFPDYGVHLPALHHDHEGGARARAHRTGARTPRWPRARPQSIRPRAHAGRRVGGAAGLHRQSGASRSNDKPTREGR